VFPSLTVGENLRAAGWLIRRDRDELDRRIRAVSLAFPTLGDRMDEPAADLSGGQQQMLALGMALLSRPRLLLIDELSLGLAPIVVSQLTALVREVAAEGTAVVLVEQSVNVALTMATNAYFIERGRVRYSGPARELTERPDLLRAVFLTDGRDAPAAAAVPVGPDDEPLERAGGTVPAGAPVPALRLLGVTRRFGGIAAVRDVTLEVAPGEVLGLIGQNGAGKTTVFDLISGYQPPDTGRVLLGDLDVTRWPPHRRSRAGLARTFQGGRLFPGLTVADAVAVALERSVDVRDPLNAALRLPAAQLSEARVRARVDELLAIFGLEEHRYSFTSELSTGTRRIVEFACSVAHQPTVLLLDEPAAGVAQREVEQLGAVLQQDPRRARLRAGRHRARHATARVDLGPPGGTRSG
jgi:ABC-type branched-subunit amino acid transport system ATPase component